MLLRCRLTRTTLFPYTTLFRSTLGIPTVGAGTRGPGNQGTTQTREPVTQGPGGTFYHARNILSLLASHLSTSQRLEQISAWADRKSTRLNSSHLGTSYAVFCLK